ncbi:conserved exported hypothetical protein [Paraburkholderia piptadeniae]|uniref:Extra-cytoplasmic solute receptor n=1 Tax=Paraburkholderia piptadeniae TaxID=1701573 RepID=A0A1N7RIP8_9BURK|nr:tripartite tricarboxylate transporter substrate binding protein [Paraburkholderia piptadeniae]SIT34988.1 conserved exported hypothetical protein [Paraburkholderia piptadeniae]
MKMNRRQFSAAVALCGLAMTAPKFAQANDDKWPSQPIQVMVPFPAGGTTDILGRMVAQQLTQRLGAQAIVNNVPGATGIIGMGQVARAKPDGYNLLIASIGTVVTNQFTYPNLPYDPKNLIPVIKLADIPNVVMVRPDLPVNTVQDLAELLRKNPGKMKFGSPGLGASGHISGELFVQQAHAKAIHVPYRGAAPMLVDLMGGRVDFVIDQISGGIEFIKSGKLKALAVTSRNRSPLLPNLPTMMESGFPNYEMAPWYCVYTTKGTPRPVVEKINETLNAMLHDPDVIAKLSALGVAPAGGTPEDLGRQADRDYAVIERLSKTINLRATN